MNGGCSALPGRFLSRHCFTLCITVEVEPRIAKQYKCQYCCSCKNYRGKGMEGAKKVSLHRFFGWPEDCEFIEKKCVLEHPIARATSYCLLSDTLWLWASKNAFKVGSIKFVNSLSPPSIVKKVLTRIKTSQGTLVMPGKSQGSWQPHLNRPIHTHAQHNKTHTYACINAHTHTHTHTHTNMHTNMHNGMHLHLSHTHTNMCICILPKQTHILTSD